MFAVQIHVHLSVLRHFVQDKHISLASTFILFNFPNIIEVIDIKLSFSNKKMILVDKISFFFFVHNLHSIFEFAPEVLVH